MIWQVVDAVDDELSRSTKLQDYANSLAFSPCCCCSVAQLCPTFCSPMNCSTPGIPIFHYLWEFAQTHVHRVSDAIQPSHPLSPPSSPALNLSQHQGFTNDSTLHIEWPKYWSFSFSISPFNEYSGWTGWISLQSKGLSRVFSNTTVQKHQPFGTQLSLCSSSHFYICYWKNHSFDYMGLCQQSDVSAF